MIRTPDSMAATDCSCGEDTCCHLGSLERPRYFPRQVVTATELTLEHDYLRDRARRHNRMLHGWGVVCGAEVCRLSDTKRNPVPWRVVIKPGFVLGPCGDEIVVDCERTVDLRTDGLMCMTGMQPGEVSDPWCGDVKIERPGTVCIAIRYREFQARPVRVHPVGCGCGGTDCEYSRWRDGYEVQLLPGCPDRIREREAMAHEKKGIMPVAADDVVEARNMVNAYDDAGWAVSAGEVVVHRQRGDDLFTCPPCPPDDWVVLACVEVDGSGTVTDIDNCGCRRWVVSTSRIALRCPEPVVHVPFKDRPSEVRPFTEETAQLAEAAPAEAVATAIEPPRTKPVPAPRRRSRRAPEPAPPPVREEPKPRARRSQSRGR